MSSGGTNTGQRAGIDLALVGMPAWDVKMPFHALVVIASVAREAGATLRVYDLNIEFFSQLDDAGKRSWSEDMNSLWFGEQLPRSLWNRHERWFAARLDRILVAKPSLVAFSVNMATRNFSVRAAKYIKAKRPEIPIMFGGVDCFPGEEGKDFLRPGAGSYCDVICQGEGEVAFAEYVRHFLNNGDWRTSVPGFVYYNGSQLIDTGQVQLPTLQGRQPTPALDLFDLSKYTKKGALPFFFSRGCPYSCQFCSETVNYRSFRYRKAEEAFEELCKILPHARRQCAVPMLKFSDSIFNARYQEFEKFIDLILEHRVEVSMGAQGHIMPQMTTQYLQRLADAGMHLIFWGIETGSQRVVNLMKKGYNVSDARRIINDCSRLGIQQHIPILIGFPGETPEDLAETLDFMMEFMVKPDVHFHLPVHVIVRKNTPLKVEPERFGLAILEDYEWTSADGTNTLPIRITRRFVARQVHSNPDLSMDQLVDTEEIKRISLNESNLAADLFRLLVATLEIGDSGQTFDDLLDRHEARVKGPQVVSSTKSGGNETLKRWLHLDKNTAEGREQVYRLVLECLKPLRRCRPQ